VVAGHGQRSLLIEGGGRRLREVVVGRAKRIFFAEASVCRSWQEETLSRKKREANHMLKHQEGIVMKAF
jgi:hypothetical protein